MEAKARKREVKDKSSEEKGEIMEVDLSPNNKFNYEQIPNYKFCLVLLDKNNKALHTPYECKDYLQDMFWSENTGKDVNVYGLEWKAGKFDPKSPRFRLALLGGQVNLKPIVKSLQEFLNYFDRAQEIELTKVFETKDEKVIVVDFDNKWAFCGPMLSAFTTLIRVSGAYKNGDPIDYLKSIVGKSRDSKMKPDYIKIEVYRLENTLPKIAALLAGKRINYSWDATSDGMNAHNTGIHGYTEFPIVDVK